MARTMSRSRIEWAKCADGRGAFVWNPVTGCRNGCTWCWARAMVKRFPARYPNGFEPTFHDDRLGDNLLVPDNSTVLTCIMGDLFSPGVEEDWIEKVHEQITMWPEPTYLLLTKRPDRVPPWFCSEPMQPVHNLWLGTSVESQEYVGRIADLLRIDVAHRWLSLEPLRGPVDIRRYVEGLIMPPLSWVVIGSQSGPGAQPPRVEWIIDILEACNRAGVPVFLKDNALSVLPDYLRASAPRALPYLELESRNA